MCMCVLKTYCSVHVQGSREAARGIGGPEGDTNAAGV